MGRWVPVGCAHEEGRRSHDPRGSRGYAQGCSLVRDKYRAVFAADIEPHPDFFVLARSGPDAAAPAAVAGLTFADNGTLFSERYLDAPIESLISAQEGASVPRSGIMEIGSLASTELHAGAELMRSLPMLAWCLGQRYAICTATHQVRRMFSKLDMEFIALGAAGIDRLAPGAQTNWGDYYSKQPMTGYACIARMSRVFAAATGRYRLDGIVLNRLPGAQHAEERHLEAA